MQLILILLPETKILFKYYEIVAKPIIEFFKKPDNEDSKAEQAK